MEIEKDRHQLLDELSEPFRTSEDVQMFLRYIYKTHPAKKPEHKLDERFLRTDTIKKGVKTAIRHYHPDKQPIVLGRKWLLLCEEITKFLTNMYSEY